MSNRMDMPLDEIIELNNQQSRGKGRRGRGKRPSSGRRRGGTGTPSYLRPRSSAYSLAKSYKSLQSDLAQKRGDSFEDALRSTLGIETGTRLHISNLDYGVSNEDIMELFSELGELKQYGVHYDRSRRSNGTAYVVYARRLDALAAINKYDNVLLDGKPMKIELAKPTVQAVRSQATGRGRSSQKRARESSQSQGPQIHGRGGAKRARESSQSQGSQSRGRGRAKRAASRRKLPTTDELDADLDNYHKDALNTS